MPLSLTIPKFNDEFSVFCFFDLVSCWAPSKFFVGLWLSTHFFLFTTFSLYDSNGEHLIYIWFFAVFFSDVPLA